MTKMALPARVNPYKAGVEVDSGGSESESESESPGNSSTPYPWSREAPKKTVKLEVT